MKPRKIAFLRLRPVPYFNSTVAQILCDAFPEYDIDVIDVYSLLPRRKFWRLQNILEVPHLYGRDLLLRRKSLIWAVQKTTSYLEDVRRVILNRLAESEYVFTFQIQSLFDASTESAPHFVYTDHTMLANMHYLGGERRIAHKSFLEKEHDIYNNATIVFTRSTNIVRSLTDQYGLPSAKIRCAYGGTNVPIAADCYGNSKPENKNVLFVGVDWLRKGGEELLVAWEQVLLQHPDAHLTIVGHKPKTHLPNIASIGRIPLSQVDAFYHDASVFCLPTKLEPFGIVFVEALTHGLPIVGTNIGAIPDMVVNDQNGYLVSPGKADELADALIRVLNDPAKRVEFGQYSLQLAIDRFNWRSVGNALRQNIVPYLP